MIEPSWDADRRTRHKRTCTPARSRPFSQLPTYLLLLGLSIRAWRILRLALHLRNGVGKSVVSCRFSVLSLSSTLAATENLLEGEHSVRLRRVLKCGFAVVAFSLATVASGMAQQYQILRADYGYANQRVDVPQRLS